MAAGAHSTTARRHAAPAWSSGFRRLLPRAIGLSGLTIVGQLSFLLALPLLSRLFAPASLGLFTIYLSVVNIAGPLVGLKFESAQFGLIDRHERCVSLRLSVVTAALMSLCGTGLILLLVPMLMGEIGTRLRSFVVLLPVGMFLSGMWSISTAWAVRENALGTLSAARFLQPFSMTVLQVVFGLLHCPPVSLALAHLISHAIYSAYILSRTIGSDDLQMLAGVSRRAVAHRAISDRRFPLYVMPAFLMTVLIGNAPPLLMGAIFGTDLAGHYGVAYRVVTGPLAVICLPLGNLFTSEASQPSDPVRLKNATRFVLTFNLCLVAVPVLLFAFAAPEFCRVILGPRWATAGEIMTALAVMGAAQALAAPFSEITSIYHRQETRLIVDTVHLVLFFLPLAYGCWAGWDAISTVRIMAAGGAGGYLLSTCTSLLILRTELGRMGKLHPAHPAQ